MAADAVDATADRLDEIVYRWSYDHLLGGRGMGPVATSLGLSELRDWHGGLEQHVSMDRSLPETPAWSFCRVRLENRHALVLREAAVHAGNRPGTNAHVLVDPELSVGAHTMLATAWLHEERGGGLTGSRTPLAEVPENAPLRGTTIRPEAFDPAILGQLRERARARPELLEVVLAAVLRDHHRTFTLHQNDVGADMVPLLWGVFDLAQPIAPGMWTFSTYETSDAALKPRFVLVPRWPNAPEPANRLRIDPRAEPQPGQDVFRDAAGLLVQWYCTRPWTEVDALLARIETAIGADGASYREVADLVLALESDATRPAPAVAAAPEPRAPEPPRAAQAPPASRGPQGPPVPPESQAGAERWENGYTETWINGSEDDEQDCAGETGGYPERDRYGRGAAPGYARPGPSSPGPGQSGSALSGPGQSGSAPPGSGRSGQADAWRAGDGANRAGPMPAYRPTVGGDGPVPPRPDRLAPVPGASPRPESGSGSRPVLPPNGPTGRLARGTWDPGEWERLGASRNGYAALEAADGLLARSSGHETSDFRDVLTKVDSASLAVALLLARPPLLAPVVYRLDRLLHPAYGDGGRPERHTRQTYARVLGRLSEDINTLDTCGAPRETLCRLVEMVARHTVAEVKRPRFGADVLPTLAVDVAGTVWALRTSLRVWADYQNVLVDVLCSSRYREPFLLEMGRLTVESFQTMPHRTGP
ncbi:hypothetical protein B4N89_23605 [Embleya scabrispora]|uniref:Uncharacterized protein n=1 Tax=Embleya scabrispora TaxID=159449 RepID=A0A1T3P3E3_9ACTN|nr:hypothetical protein [Embleya scabrispora]OPC83524.1 hypothetical protein B4N89_23605 [Embleya scabrispora]